ncbi:MAG: glutamine--fructose-6-phosphate transaminase (isomerizing) [Mariprofundales bacterium]
MCGVIGALSTESVEGMLITALARMEYRGYDSSGICIANQEGLQCVKQAGKLHYLVQALAERPITGNIGIGHTRWATHGKPTINNAHPHLAGHVDEITNTPKVAVVHNGIIENHLILRERLLAQGASFCSDTDTETVPWLWRSHIDKSDDEIVAWQNTVNELEGAYALTAMRSDDDALWFARKGSPLLLGRNENSIFAASDMLALAGLAEEVLYLDEGDLGRINMDSVQIFNAGKNISSKRHWQAVPLTETATGKDGYEHYMLKEIHEQPRVLSNIINTYAPDLQPYFSHAQFIHEDPLPERMVLVACGTSYHAALTARYWLERLLNIPVEVDVASEYRYRDPVIGDKTWFISLSQSGETADTLEALRVFKKRTPNNLALTICNVPHSSIVRESDGFIALQAGPEIGVASTKAFTAQLTILALLTFALAKRAGVWDEELVMQNVQSMRSVVAHMQNILTKQDTIKAMVPLFKDAHGALFLGRGPCFPLALEGALKLKEISYLHAEGYAAGEMKHGPIALVDEYLPVITLAASQYELDKMLANLQEVKARGARLILITDADILDTHEEDHVLRIPHGNYFTTPLLASIPLQLLAYEVARARGTDVDQPRNLAKSVTVE